MNRSAIRLAALVLPLVGLASAWIVTHVRAQQGVEWDVPVSGYDPRDLLRGHYILFRYEWPGLKRDDYGDGIKTLCIEGAPPVIARSFLGQACANPVGGTDIWASDRGQLYVPQRAAPLLEEKLRDPRLQAFVRIRLRADGHITPLRMTFRRRGTKP